VQRFYEKQSHSRMADLAEQALGDLRSKRQKLTIRGGQYEVQQHEGDGDGLEERGGSMRSTKGGAPSRPPESDVDEE